MTMEFDDTPDVQPVTEFKEIKPKDLIKKKQFELSDSDVDFLGSNQYTDTAWEVIGRKHGIDASTREALPNTRNRAFVAVPKRYTDETVPTANPVLTTDNFNKVPIPASQVRAELSQRKLTIPVSDETTTEEI